MDITRLPQFVRRALRWRREDRMRRILAAVNTWPGMKVIDVGCNTHGRGFSDYADPSWQITGIDLHQPHEVSNAHPNFTYFQMNACDMSAFADKSFDLVVSIGMLEHIVSEADYRAACSELQRVGKQYAILVPYKWAWIEPHYGVPFFGGLPKRVQIALIKMFDLSQQRDGIDFFLQNFCWRSNAQYLRDFPGARIKFMPTLETVVIVKST